MTTPAAPARRASATAPLQVVERASAGLAMLLEKVPRERKLAVLDLGPAVGASLGVYSEFARWIRFADALNSGAFQGGWREMLAALPGNPQRPYDLIFGLDILERLPPEARRPLMTRLAELCVDEAKLFLVMDAPDARSIHEARFGLVGRDGMSFERTGEVRQPVPALAPSEMKRALRPFVLEKAFTTQIGVREYVTVRRAREEEGEGEESARRR